MIEQVLRPALLAHRDMAAHRRCAAVQNSLDCAGMTRQNGGAVALQISRSVPLHDIGEPGHRLVLQVDHHPIERFLQTLGTGLSDMHV